MSNFGVIKRDGSRTEFEIQRIINAIKKPQVRSIFPMNFIATKLGKK